MVIGTAVGVGVIVGVGVGVSVGMSVGSLVAVAEGCGVGVVVGIASGVSKVKSGSATRGPTWADLQPARTNKLSSKIKICFGQVNEIPIRLSIACKLSCFANGDYKNHGALRKSVLVTMRYTTICGFNGGENG